MLENEGDNLEFLNLDKLVNEIVVQATNVGLKKEALSDDDSRSIVTITVAVSLVQLVSQNCLSIILLLSSVLKLFNISMEE